MGYLESSVNRRKGDNSMAKRKDKQRSTTHYTKYRETRTSPKSSGLALHLQATENYMLDPAFDKGGYLRDFNSSLQRVYNKTNANIWLGGDFKLQYNW